MEPPKPGMKRVTVRPNRPNPLFEQWLDEWRQEAAEKGSDMQYCFGKVRIQRKFFSVPLFYFLLTCACFHASTGFEIIAKVSIKTEKWERMRYIRMFWKSLVSAPG